MSRKVILASEAKPQIEPSPSVESLPPKKPAQSTVASISQVPTLVKPDQAARMLGRSVDTLKRWRYEGIGPDYVVIEGRIMYDVQAIADHIRKGTRVPSVRAAREGPRGGL